MVVDWSSALTLDGVLMAIGGMVVGFVGHELMHIGTLTAFGRRPSIEIGFHRLFFAAVPPDGTPRWQNAIALLAPIVWAAIGLWALFGQFTVPLTLDAVLLIAGFSVGALPSPADVFVLLLYQPEADTTASEVVTDA